MEIHHTVNSKAHACRLVLCLPTFFLHSYHRHRRERQRHLFITTQLGPFDDVLTEFDSINTVTCVCDINIPPNYRTDLFNKDIFGKLGVLHRWKSLLISVTLSQKETLLTKRLTLKTDSAAWSGGHGKFIHIIHFLWPPLEVALSISTFCFLFIHTR